MWLNEELVTGAVVSSVTGLTAPRVYALCTFTVRLHVMMADDGLAKALSRESAGVNVDIIVARLKL